MLGNFIVEFANWHNRTYKTNYDSSIWPSYHFEEVIGTTKEESDNRVRLFFGTREFANLKPIAGAQEGVRALAKKFRLVAVTGRNPVAEKITRAWLAKNVPEVTDVYFSDAFERRDHSKSGICLKLGARVIVEDNKKYAVECASHGIPAVLLDRPWNQGILPSGVVRVRSWSDVPGIIAELQKK